MNDEKKNVGMSDLHARVDNLERKLKIIEITLQWFFEPHLVTEDKDSKDSKEYP